MSNIKLRNVANKTIKTKDTIVNVKNKSENAYNSREENENAYAVNRLSSFNKSLPFKTLEFTKLGNHIVKETKSNVIKTKDKIKSVLTEKKNKEYQ